MEPVFRGARLHLLQYVILAWLRDGIALNPRDICAQHRHDSGALTRVIDQLAERGFLGARAPRSRSTQRWSCSDPGGPRHHRGLIPLVVENSISSLADFSGAEVHELAALAS